MELLHDAVYKVEGKYISRNKVGGFVLEGANASAEEADEGTDDNDTESGLDIVLNNRLTETGFKDKKAYLTYLKDYMKRIVGKLEEEGSKDIETFKAGSNAFIKARPWTPTLWRVSCSTRTRRTATKHHSSISSNTVYWKRNARGIYILGLYAISASAASARSPRGTSIFTGPAAPQGRLQPAPRSGRQRPLRGRLGRIASGRHTPATHHATDTPTSIRRLIESVRHRDILLFIQTKYMLKNNARLVILVIIFGEMNHRILL